MTATIVVTGPFDGPNFVDGIAVQENEYTVINSTKAILTFPGGMDDSITYKQILHGTDFGVTSDGRYTGTVTGFDAYDLNVPGTAWHVTGFDTPLHVVNTTASGGIPFAQVLISPNSWNYIGNGFEDNFAGSPFDDMFTGKAGNDTFKGFSGSDLFHGGLGADTLEGNQGSDSVFGGPGDDLIKGGGDADSLHGATGQDTIHGGADPDHIFGGDGADLLFGGGAGDFIRGGKSADVAVGGAGGDRIFGGAGADDLRGGVGVDTLYGGGGGDHLSGGVSSDVLFGGSGADVIAGGRAADFIDGGPGNDILSGNVTGSRTPDHAFDAFIFDAKFGHDVITDFEVDYDTISFTGGITQADVTVTDVGPDVNISVDFHGTQSILVLGVAHHFDPSVDIFYS